MAAQDQQLPGTSVQEQAVRTTAIMPAAVIPQWHPTSHTIQWVIRPTTAIVTVGVVEVDHPLLVLVE